uniref:Protein-PII uridylyltransferase N-terminal domain-containing protein n=1 Tax=Branchiostoma floridae TaxID=7739 RepID=C3Y010_BRAFL|eukprot:XP_002610366.1 hypothetical protein BRAFLDRAFT_72426 [Branchiostoma floridae]
MSGNKTNSLADKLQNLELGLKSQRSQEVGYGRSLREAILSMDVFMEVEILKGLGDLHLQEGKWGKDSTEIDKAAALYAAALLRCTDSDMGKTIEHRIGYMEKLSRQLLQGYTPHFRWLSPDYWGTTDSNVLRVAEICGKLDNGNTESRDSVEETYTETLVTAIENGDMFLELEVLKSLGDLYLEKGRKTFDVSQFPKAAAMYKKAMTRCEDPETKITLHHRICYTEKTREAVRRQSTSKKRRQTGRRPPMDQSRQYTEHLNEGDSSLARADLDSAEQHFAAALKTVHNQDPTAQQYQREVEPLCKLGEVYSKRGQQTRDGGDFVKAAALYNAAIARSEDQVLSGNIDRAIKEVNKSFLKYILDIHCNTSKENTEKHKKQLKEMRDQIKLEIETIDQQLDPYVHDEDPCVREIEAKRAQAVRLLFENIAQQRKEFISLLVDECIRLMGSPPCKYALIGLGSQAIGLVTPYSDLEFAILVEDESEACRVYFRKFTHYLHLKVVNLGETILPTLGIKSLNDFYSENPLANWYYDSVTPRGFAFDGFMPKASKTPLGRQGTANEQSSELICTPNNMASILQNDVTLYLKEGYHLATILRNPCLIEGDQGLIDTYMAITEMILQAGECKISQQLAQETQEENIRNYMYNDKETITARLIDVKKNVYRFPALAVDCLALSSQIKPTTVWKMIEQLKNKQVISPNNAHHLTVLTSISAELRLRTYIANGGQRENLSALVSMETMLNKLESIPEANEEVYANTLKPVFHLSNEKQLFRYYHTAVPLKSALSKWSGRNPDLQPFYDFYDNSPRVQGLMYFELCKYRQAISYFQEALEAGDGTNTEDNMLLLFYIGTANLEVGHYQKAINYVEQAVKMHGKIPGQSTPHSNITAMLNNLSSACSYLGDHRKSINFCKQALEMSFSIYGQTTAHPSIVASLNNLGGACFYEGDYRKAISYHEQALQVNRRIYGETTAHPGNAILLTNLGTAWDHLGNYNRAVTYHEQALQLNRKLYGQCTAHPQIASSLDSLGAAWSELGEHWKAVSFHEQALQMLRSIYGQSTAHPLIVTSLCNLGLVWHYLGQHRKGISYHEQALQMNRKVYGQSAVHHQIASSLDNLGGGWSQLGDYSKAVSYHEQALQMRRNVYGQSTAHPDIATSLNNLGTAWQQLGDVRNAISYHEQALEMSRSVFGQTKAHPLVAVLLNNLAEDFCHLGEHRAEVKYQEQSLQMFRNIYGQATEHPQIAILLNNLGVTWNKLGKHRKALSYHEQALQMRRSIYGPQTAHPETASSLNNLGTVLCKLGDFKAASSSILEAFNMMKQIYHQDLDHPMIKSIKKNLVKISVVCNNGK